MSQITIEGEAWAAIMADPKLEKARRKLSFHEIRLIMNHARRDLTERAAHYEIVISELSAKLDAAPIAEDALVERVKRAVIEKVWPLTGVSAPVPQQIGEAVRAAIHEKKG